MRWTFAFLLATLAAAPAAAGPHGSGSMPTGAGPSLPAPAAGWVAVPDPQPPRRASYVLPRERGDTRDAELVVFFFGEGNGGSAEANVARWKTLFEPPAGRSIDDVTSVKTREQGKQRVTIVDISGTYLYRARPVDSSIEPERRPGHRMIAAAVEGPAGPYFVRLVGPARTVARHQKAFDAWLARLR